MSWRKDSNSHDAALEQTPVLESLADDEDAAEQDRRREPAGHRAAACCCRLASERQIVKLLANRQRLKMPVLSRSRSCAPGPGCGVAL